ncbi:hypothetical protein HNO89_003690 [Sporosarcina luteola]|nr:hypothetical protein [Sporosarcina luteola]
MNLSVPNAVWLAAAVLTYEKYKAGGMITVSDIAFKQSVIQQYATRFTDKNVDSARISQWANGDHPANTYNYLRDVDGERRLTAPGEFGGEKEQPSLNLAMLIDVQLNGLTEEITISELQTFITHEYAPFIASQAEEEIDFDKIIKHLQTYANERYESPEALTGEEKQHYLDIRESGQQAVAELNKMSILFERKHGLHCPTKSKWLTGGNDVVRGYLWNQFKYEEKYNIPSSILILADKRNVHQDVRFRISIEVDEKSASEEYYETHHKILNETFQTDNNFCYYVKHRNERESYRTNVTRDQIKGAWLSGEVVKVQLVYELYNEQIVREKLSNKQIFLKLQVAFDYLRQFYDIAVGIGSNAIGQPAQDEVGEEAKVEMYPKNMILYGPPGTGKTYNTLLYAVAIIENKTLEQLKQEDYHTVLKRYSAYKDASQIQFTTFHQSYGYEEFIEGIKPKLNDESTSEIQYEVTPGVFKQFCTNAQHLKVITDDEQYEEDVRLWKISIGGSGDNYLKEMCFEESEIRIGWPDANIELAREEGYTNDSLYYFFEEMKEGDIVFSLGDQKHIDAIGIITSDAYKDVETDEDFPHARKVQWIATGIKERVYEQNGHKNLTQKTVYELTRISKDAVNHIINKYSENSFAKVEENKNNYVFIIDEINRGNISKILGELITLIESTKRLGAKEAMTVTLPYSQESFGVPDNVYILGTMNTADRSIALMDTALRRRFQFIEMMPDTKLLQNVIVEEIDVQKMVEAINKRIEVLYDREHMIGHAYFMSLKEQPSIENLARIFENAVIPLMQEYFYEDYSKIQLILGDNAKQDEHKFILDRKVQNVFKGYTDIDMPDYNYEIQLAAFRKKTSYTAIYE